MVISSFQEPQQVAKARVRELKSEWLRASPDLEKIGQLLHVQELRLYLLNIQFQADQISVEDRLTARSVLEIGVLWSIAVRNLESFERFMVHLKSYYTDLRGQLPESDKMYCILGLNLLFLLSQNRVADFHTELEKMSTGVLHDNAFIKHSVALEQYIMEGSYNKIFVAAHIVPDPSYKFFTDILLETIRNEIATCFENSYPRISMAEASEKLQLTGTEELQIFAKSRGWVLNDDGYFSFSTGNVLVDNTVMQYSPIIEHMLTYAKEMENII